MKIQELARASKAASIDLAVCETTLKNAGLKAIAEALTANTSVIIAGNQKDLERSRNENLELPLLKRLLFDESKIQGVVEGINSLIKLEDPVGETISAKELDEGLELYRVSCPIGVIGVIFESRPDALVQIATLCLKSGNSVLLKGGSEARETNRILAKIITDATASVGISEGWLQLLETRSEVSEMLKLHEYIDLIIPRGSNEFVRYIMNNSNIPVLGHADGICHLYIDKTADMQMAVAIAVDSKTQYVAGCNATETILVNEAIASKFLPLLKAELDVKNVEMFGCEITRAIISAEPATGDTWRSEYLDYKVSVKVVRDINDAIDHINTYGSHHTESIVTSDTDAVETFMNRCDSGNVMWNCSTRFSDGFRYGLGAEVGISTNKIHARGPVGLEGLLTYKWKLKGNGHVVSDYATGLKKFTHREIDRKFGI